MHEQYQDRLLRCVDCNGDFMFTAGEQIFFFSKQFQNDPKRCKPCKSRRSGLLAAANGLPIPARATPRPETRTECSACGVETTVPFRPTQGRPVLCRACFSVRGVPSPRLTTETAALLTEVSVEPDGAMLSADAALLAATSVVSARDHCSISSAHDLALAAQWEGLEMHPEAEDTPSSEPEDLLALRSEQQPTAQA